MAIPKKGSPLITVDGTVFRWRVRHEPTYDARPDNWLAERTLAIRPALVVGCIRRAVEQGWNSGQPGSGFTLTVTEDELAVLLGEPPQYRI